MSDTDKPYAQPSRTGHGVVMDIKAGHINTREILAYIAGLEAERDRATLALRTVDAQRERLELIVDRATEIIRKVVADDDEIDLTHAISFLEGHDTGPGEYAKLLDQKHRVVDELGAAKGTIGVLKQDAEHNAKRAEKAEADLAAAQKRIMVLEAIAPNDDDVSAEQHAEVKEQLAAAYATIVRAEHDAVIADALIETQKALLDKAESALTRAGYTRCDGEAGWKPPGGKKPLSLSVQRWSISPWDSHMADIRNDPTGELILYADLLAWERAETPRRVEMSDKTESTSMPSSYGEIGPYPTEGTSGTLMEPGPSPYIGGAKGMICEIEARQPTPPRVSPRGAAMEALSGRMEMCDIDREAIADAIAAAIEVSRGRG